MEPTKFWSWRTLSFWSLQCLWWLVYFWSQFSGEAIFASVPWDTAKKMWGAVVLVHFGLTTLVRWWSKQFRWLALSPGQLLARIVAAWLISSLIVYGATIAMAQWLYDSP